MKIVLPLISIVFFFFTSCNYTENKVQNVHSIQFANPIVKKLLIGFINSVLEENNPHFITIDLTYQNDTIVLSMANTYPDFRHAHFNAYDTLNGYRLIYIGEINKGFYTITKKNEIPADILDLSKKMFQGKYPSTIDPHQWFFYFKNNLLIGYFPTNDVENNVQGIKIDRK